MRIAERKLRRIIRNVVSEVSDHRESSPRQTSTQPIVYEGPIVQGTRYTTAEYITYELEDQYPGEDNLQEDEKIQEIIHAAITEWSEDFYPRVLDLVNPRVLELMNSRAREYKN